MVTGYSQLQNQSVSTANGVNYVYRDTGHGEGVVPLVLLQHFRGNLDNWDPALIDALAASAIGVPVFVTNGDSDPMILPRYSYLLAGLIPDARLKIYPDSAHGFLFQHHAEFAADVGAFLG
jgi:pimeloyl-ACP methyl ester carboxylesterase